MNRNQQLKTLNSPKASKEQLREALAASLGVVYERPTKEKAVTVFTQCRDVFLEAYKEQTKIDYSFGAKDGVALSQIIKKIGGILENNTDGNVVLTFRALIEKMPDWYKQNAFSLSRINGSFNEITASIKSNGAQPGVTESYEQQILRKVFS